MNSKYRVLLVALVVGAGGVSLAASTASTASAAGTEAAEYGSDDATEGPDIEITGPDLVRASAVALDHTGEGWVSDTEVEDEESYYEVEVTLDNGREVDIQLDESFNVVGTD